MRQLQFSRDLAGTPQAQGLCQGLPSAQGSGQSAAKGVAGRGAVDGVDGKARLQPPLAALARANLQKFLIRKLLEARQKLADLRNKAAGNDKFEDLLNEVLQNTDKIAQLSKEVGPKSDE